VSDQFTMHEDGTVTLGWRDFSVTLREPEIGEWLSFTQEADRAEKWARGEDRVDEDGDSAPEDRSLAEAADGGPFLALYRRLIAELGIGLTGEIPDLPLWLVRGEAFTRISAWWSATPLSRREAQTVTRTLSR